LSVSVFRANCFERIFFTHECASFILPAEKMQGEIALMRILWILSDGKRGHENQSLGLAEALGRLQPWSPHLVELPHGESLLKHFSRLRDAIALLPRPEIVIAAGHSTHLLLLYTGWATGARTVLLMKPSLPCRWFDFCFIPKHDLKPHTRLEKARGILTVGAINRMRYDPTVKDGSVILLVGGPSRAYDWDADELLEQVVAVVRAEPERRWRITNSPRTPAGFLPAVKAALPEVEVFPVESTSPDWLTHALGAAEFAWVSEDSVSMIYEALTAGAKVGVLAMPSRGSGSKHSRGLAELSNSNQIVTYSEWRKNPRLLQVATPLAEADRCARYLIGKL
jgi:mitochondrial fission protein ELM1